MTPQQQAQFFDRVAALLNSGVTLEQSFILASQDNNPSLRRYLQQLISALKSGKNLTSSSLSPPYFDAWTLRLIQAALSNGSLPETCQRLARAMERQHRWGLLYRPIWLATATTLLSASLLAIALVQGTTNFLMQPSFWLTGLVVLGLLIGANLMSSKLYAIAFKLPIVGKLVQLHSLLYFTEISLPLRCGIPILTALELIESHIPDRSFATSIRVATRQLRTGTPLSESLKSKLPPQAIQMIRTGEETGHLDSSLDRLALYCQTELERSLHQIKGILLPVSILATGGLVALIGIRAIAALIHSLPS